MYITIMYKRYIDIFIHIMHLHIVTMHVKEDVPIHIQQSGLLELLPYYISKSGIPPQFPRQSDPSIYKVGNGDSNGCRIRSRNTCLF